jgi:signal transduction histidine kinase
MDSLKNLIWKVDSQEIALRDLANEINTVTKELLASHQIPYQLDLSGFEKQGSLPSKTYHHLMMIYKEALNNAIRHGDQKKVAIDFVQKDSTMSIRLKNGIPEMPTIASGSNKGLQNMKERIALLGGEVVFNQADGQFEVQINLAHV